MKSLKSYALAGFITCTLASTTFTIDYNNFFHRETVKITCENQRKCGKTAFGQDKYCSGSTACRRTDFGDFCNSIRSQHCNPATAGCKSNEVLDPTRFCECITRTERKNMFCEDSDIVID